MVFLCCGFNPNLSCINGLNKGYFMLKVTVRPPTTDTGAIQCLFDNLEFLIARRSDILSVPEYYNVLIPGCYVAGLYIGTQQLCLGDLLSLWQDVPWHSGTRYYFSIIGSPLSGSNQARYWDAATQTINNTYYQEASRGFAGLWVPANKHIQENTAPKGLRTRPSGIDIKTLLDKLKQYSR